MKLTDARRKYLFNFGVHLGGLYGSKGFDLVILMMASRVLPMGYVGAVFLADAIGGALLRLIDLGLFPVLFRRAAREEAGPRILAWGTSIRAAGLVLLSLAFAPAAPLVFEERTSVGMAFFLLSGFYVLHEIPRAILAGRERFALTAITGLVLKGAEAACTVGGLLLGLGVWSWVAGRALSQVGMLAALYFFAHREIRGLPSPSAHETFREGLPFWAASAVNATLHRLDTIIVGTYLGLVESAHLGIAGKVVGGALNIVTSMVNVAFPTLARRSHRFAAPAQVFTVAVIALGLSLTVFAGAPMIVRIVTGKPDAAATMVLRTMTPVIALSTVVRSLTAWLQAKNKERSVAAVSVVASSASALALVALVPALATPGAALARVLRDAVNVTALGLLTYVTAQRIHAPVTWAFSRVPAAGRLIRRIVLKKLPMVARRLAAVPGVAHVEVRGSAAAPERYRPGESDIDLVVTTRTWGDDLPTVVRRCGRTARRWSFAGRIDIQVVDHEVLRFARRAGHPVLGKPGRVLAGEPVVPPVDEENAWHWHLTQSATDVMRIQRDALEDGWKDGNTRADRIAKDLRFLLEHLQLPAPEARARLSGRGLTLPDWIAEDAPPPTWLTPAETADLLVAANELLASAYAEASKDWSPVERPEPSPTPWLESLDHRLKWRVEQLAGLRPLAIHLTPTGPTDDDPMLVVVPDAWSSRDWIAWLRLTAAEGPLRLPFRAHRWPLVLPAPVLAADALLERAMLLHAARAHAGRDLYGTSPAGLEPPPHVPRSAAIRETLQAMLRIPADVERLEREASFRAAELTDPRVLADHWRFRVRAQVSGRLAALSLMLDHGEVHGERRSVVAAYLARYDDELASLMRDDPKHVSGPRLAHVLLAWARDREERLRAADVNGLGGSPRWRGITSGENSDLIKSPDRDGRQATE